MKIYTATHPLEAHMLMQLLHQQGIACELRGEMLFARRDPDGFQQRPFTLVTETGATNRSAANHPRISQSPTRRMLAMPRVWGAS